MNRFDFDESTYGSWTAQFDRLLELTDRVEFFRSGGDTTGEATEIAQELVELLGEPLVVRLESGDWPACDSLMGEVAPWADELGQLIEEQTERIMADPSLVTRIVPPLWPVPGMLNVVEVVVADKERVLVDVPPSYREVGWRLGCAVEKWAWGALRWSIAYPEQKNPFEVALRLAEKGIFPIGKRGKELIFFSFASSSLSES